MKVILLCDVKKQGKKDDIIDVADGYAKNYLIKNNLAVKYSETSSKILKNEIKERENVEQQKINKALELKEKIEKEKIKFNLNCGDKGKVFGTISKSQIKEEFKNKGYSIKTQDIILDTPISSLGTFEVKIILYKKVIAKILVNVEESK